MLVALTPLCRQVLEDRGALDDLQHVQAAPRAVAEPELCRGFVHSVPQLVQAATALDEFMSQLQTLLFPGQRTICAMQRSSMYLRASVQAPFPIS